MAVLAGVEPRKGKGAGEGRLSWPVFLLALAAVTSSSLSALSLHQLVALKAEVEALKSEISLRRGEGQEARHRGQVCKLLVTWDAGRNKKYDLHFWLCKDCVMSVQAENTSSRRNIQMPLHQPEPQRAFNLTRRKRMVRGTETTGKTAAGGRSAATHEK